jgi:predicted chitinase
MVKVYTDREVNYAYSCKILMKLEFSRQVIKKYSDTKFVANPRVGAELVHAGRQTDRHDEANSRCWQFCERAKKPALFTTEINISK